jgi:hypothetical protein
MKPDKLSENVFFIFSMILYPSMSSLNKKSNENLLAETSVLKFQ